MENLHNSGVAPQSIPLHVIEEFTKNFSEDQKIGHGTYGDVYKGIYKGEEVAVKLLRFSTCERVDEMQQFKNEFENIVHLRHENIVRLLAYCYETKYKYVELSKGRSVLAEEIHRALCFEYLQNGSLQKHLYDEYHGLDWKTRYKIIKGMCEALKYLQEELEVPVLHLDLKPDNILLDKNMVPKLADFGLSKLFTEEQTRSVQSAEQTESQQSAVGTIGFMPPEYIDRNVISEKFDIFSVGVTIIMIMTGGQGYSKYNTMSPQDEFIDLVHKNWRNRLLQERAAYTTLEEECHQVKICIEIALDCLHSDPEDRPKIGSIVQRLNETENKIEKLAISLPHEAKNDPGSHANKIRAPKVLIQVKPQELCYHYSIELNNNLASSLQLTNMTHDHVAYMFVVSDEMKYSTRAKGIISPRSTWEVVLNIKAQDKSNLKHEDKVVLRSTIVSKDLKATDITLDMFKKNDIIVDEVKLDIVMVAPTVSQSSAQEEFGKQQSHEITGSSKMLDVQPLELRFPFERNKLVPCSLHLTNITDKHVAFRLTEKSGESGCFVNLPLHGILPPGSVYTLIVTTSKRETQPQKQDYDLILQSCVLGDENVLAFKDQSECDQFFTEVKELGGLVREFKLKAVSAPEEKPSEVALPGIKILFVESTSETLYCLDTNPMKKWVLMGYISGYVRIWNYQTQRPVNFYKVSNTAVFAVKFIARKRWFVAGSFDGFLHVYDYGTKLSNKKKSWKACGSFITSLAIHPTHPYVLSSANGDPIKLWNWEEGWECTQTFKDHCSLVHQLVFNPKDTNVFASASNDKTVKVWKLDSPDPEYTLDGHSGKVTCLDYFSCGDHQYLISGSNDQTAKIWDLQKRTCVQTLDAFLSPLTCVSAHPNLPVLITGSEDGVIHVWSSFNFSLERILNIASCGDVQGVRCLMGSRRAVIGQSSAISMLSIDSMIYQEASVPCSGLYLSGDGAPEETTPGDSTSEASHVPSGDPLEVHPLQLHFPDGLNKLTPCAVHLTNNTNELVAFRLMEKSGVNNWGCFVSLPLQGVVPPRSTYILIVTTNKLKQPPQRQDFDLILQSSAVTEKHIRPFNDQYGCDRYFTEAKGVENRVHEVTLKAVYGSLGEKSLELAPLAVKVLSVESIHSILCSFDTNEVKQWIIIGDAAGYVRIRNYETQKPVDFVKVSKTPVDSTKFILRKRWFVAASSDGFICVYNYKTKMRIIRFKACGSFITSLAVHPTKPYVLSSANGDPIKLWNWEACCEGRWECQQTFEGHTSVVRQITFNPLDTNTFASASDDHTVKVWNLASPDSEYTFSGHSGKVNCVDYFTRGDKQFLISGSDDQTAKIWDLKERKCVQTIEAFLSPIISIGSHPNLPVLITGSDDGSVALWSSTDFRLESILNIACHGDVMGLVCLMSSRRAVIVQSKAVSVLTIDNMEIQEAVACNEPPITGDVSLGDTSCEKKSPPSELLDVEPLQLDFPFGLDKLMPCSLKLTNKTNELVAFRLMENWCFLTLPLCGVVLPRSTYTLVVTTRKLNNPPQTRDLNVILQSSILGNQNIYPFKDDSEYGHFFSEVKEVGEVVHEVTIRVVYGQQGKSTSEGITNGIKILSVEKPPQRLASLDVNQTDPWILTGDSTGHVRIMDNNTQRLVASSKDTREIVDIVKFITRKKWILAGSNDGFIYVYNYENKLKNIKRIKASTSFITSLAVHPILPLVLSTANGSPIKLWNWDKQWECTQEYCEHSSLVRQVAFNPINTNSLASASVDHSVKVWNLDLPDSVCTLEGHSDEVTCLDYFTCDGKQYLITGSKDQTAKIWDLERKMCIETLDAFVTAVISLCSHPSLPHLITGSEDGIVHFWSATTFRLEKVLNFGFGDVVSIGCFKDSQRVVIGQEWRVSVIEVVDEEPAAEQRP